MQLVARDDETTVQLVRLDVVLTAGGTVSLVAWPDYDQFPQLETTPKMGVYRLGLDGEIILDSLEVRSLAPRLHDAGTRGWLLQVQAVEERAPETVFRVWQRGQHEALADYIGRWLAPYKVRPANAKVGVLEDLESVFCPGI